MKQTVYGAIFGILFAFLLAGCNDDSSSETTINEEADIPTNSAPFIAVDQGGLNNTTVIDLTTGTEVPYSIWVEQNGTNGLVFIRSTPAVEDTVDPATE
jgi:hypothetical protein